MLIFYKRTTVWEEALIDREQIDLIIGSSCLKVEYMAGINQFSVKLPERSFYAYLLEETKLVINFEVA